MKWIANPNSVVKSLAIPPIPRNMLGLRKDGQRDRRFRRDTTYAELRTKLAEMKGEE